LSHFQLDPPHAKDVTGNVRVDDAEILRLIPRYLACPRCHGPLEARDLFACCIKCDYAAGVREGVVLSKPETSHSFFDDRYRAMREANQTKENWNLFYAQQAERAEQIIRPGAVILDVGCGPEVPYSRQSGWFIIGLEPSFDSVSSNDAVDLRVYGTAEAIPVPDSSIDGVVCFYSIHHMTGERLSENRGMVTNVFREFARVIRPGGNLLIFDLSPWWPFSTLENMTWNLARRMLGPKLDMYFWDRSRLLDLGQETFPSAKLEVETFRSSPFVVFPPVFSVPALKIPRFLYPFAINLYNWRF
jgi:SAM-dependent methyltransferase